MSSGGVAGGGSAIGPRGNEPPPPARRVTDTYQDPFDTRQGVGGGGGNAHHQPAYDPRMNSSREDYADPFDTKFTAQKNMSVAKQKKMQHQPAVGSGDDAEYDEPYERRPIANDTYEDPWDTRRSIDLTEGVLKNHPAPIKTTHAPQIKTTHALPAVSNSVKIVNKKDDRRDDYSDPWDSRLSGSLTNEEYDDTYSEPYDKGKQSILDESVRRSVSRTNDNDDDDDDDDDDDIIYDMPEEEKVIIGIGAKSNNQGYVPLKENKSGSLNSC